MLKRQVWVGVTFALFVALLAFVVPERWATTAVDAAEAAALRRAFPSQAETGRASRVETRPPLTAVASLSGGPLGPSLEGELLETASDEPSAEGAEGAEGADGTEASEPSEPSEDGLPAASDGGVEADPETLDANLVLGALSKQTAIRSRPSHSGALLGYLRTGMLLRRAAVPASYAGCRDGWYRVEPRGYVCVGKAATVDPEHPILRLASVAPDRSLGLPYIYGRSRYPTPPLYTKVPTDAEQRIAEQDLEAHLKKGFGREFGDDARAPPPPLLEGGARIPRPYGYPMLEREFMTGRALANSAFAFLDLFESEGRSYGLTTDLSLVPLDRVTRIEPSEFFGTHLSSDASLPVAFVRSHQARVFTRAEATGQFAFGRVAAYRESFHLTGEKVRFGGLTLLAAKNGEFVEENPRVVLAEVREKLPKWATGERTWIDISILRQTLVAYVGARPVFATLVSTGKDGLGDPETTHSTVQGVFLVHTKHVTATMSGNQADDEFDLRDVPWVQYFEGGYALHAAYWHDAFGAPRSHGCINLSPADARYLFHFSEPRVPERWHTALSRDGTLVYIHP